MLCVSIRPGSESELIEDFEKAKKLGDLVEVRTDGFKKIPVDTLQRLVKTHPVILSMGQHAESSKLLQLAALAPHYLDVPLEALELDKLRTRYPKLKIISSFHNFHETPDNLEECLIKLESQKADIIKLVTHAKTT